MSNDERARVDAAKSFRELLKIVGVSMGDPKPRSLPKPRRDDGYCKADGCTNPGGEFGYCPQRHELRVVLQWLDNATSKQREIVRDYVDQLGPNSIGENE